MYLWSPSMTGSLRNGEQVNGRVRKLHRKSNTFREGIITLIRRWASSKKIKKLFLWKPLVSRTDLIARFRSSILVASAEPSRPSNRLAPSSDDCIFSECGRPPSILNSLLFLSPHHLPQYTHSSADIWTPSAQLSSEFPSSIFFSLRDTCLKKQL